MKSIFITGASSGIGKATAIYFAQQGWQVIATMRRPESAQDLASYENIVRMELDVTNENQIKETCQKALAQYDIDVLLNNAGYGIMAPLEHFTKSQIQDLFNTDVLGTMLVTQQFIPHFKKRRQGVIFVTTSLAGIIALPRDSVYGAAKHAQQGMAESLYYELKPYNIAVKTLIPGGTNTNFNPPINELGEYAIAAKNQRLYLLDGNKEFPGPDEAAIITFNAATDNKDQLCYPTDSVAQKLYDEYQKLGIESFKNYFYNKVFTE